MRTPERGAAARIGPADNEPVRPHRRLAATLAASTFVLILIAEFLSLQNHGAWLGPGLLGVSAAVAILAWLALGAPISHRSVAWAREE